MLTDVCVSQVNAFLAGRSPLTLAMRLGEHMMFVQLQLSTSPPALKHAAHPPHRCVRKSAPHPQRVASVPSSMPGDLHSTPHGSFTRTPAASACDAGSSRAPAGPVPRPGTSPQIAGGSPLSKATQNVSQKLKEFSQVPRTQGDQVCYADWSEFTLHSFECFGDSFCL